MLFLLNNQIVEVELPEIHLARRWRRIGCGTPYAIRPLDVVNFVHARLDQARIFVRGLEHDEACDLASLIIARTGANSFMLRVGADGGTFPVLRHIPDAVLEAYYRGAANDEASTTRRARRNRVALN